MAMTPILTLLLALLLLTESSWAFSSIRNGITTNMSSRQQALLKASTSSTAEAAPVQKVAIIGAGIAGLSLAHALRSANLNSKNNSNNAPIQIDIFDSRSELDEKSGSGIQLTGGMAALRRISPELQRTVSEAALPLERVVSKCRPWFGAGEGWKILELDIQEAIREKEAAADERRVAQEEGNDNGNGDGEKYGLVTEEGEVLAYTILRGTMQRILHEGLMQEHGIEVQFDKRLSGMSFSDSDNQLDNVGGEGIVCQFADGSKTGPYDLVVGCDGIQSAVRQFVNTGDITTSTEESKSSSAIYSGLRITFAIQEGTETDDDIKGCQFNQLFGNGAYALISSYGAGKGKKPAKGAFLVYPDKNYIGPFPKTKSNDNDVGAETTAAAAASNPTEPVPLDENADWTQDKRVPRDHVTECLEVLQSASIPGNDVASIIENSDRFFDLGVYLHNPFSWNGWMREVPRGASNGDGGIFGGSGEKTAKYAITTGDAAHAMPPFLGQGANQALQDSCSLAAKIIEYNSQVQEPQGINDPSKPDLKRLLKEYESQRWLPTTSITAKAAFLGYLEVGPSVFANFRDAFFFVMGKIGVAEKVFLDAATPKM
eukprot:CAMPEP_0172315074 /NCGR_PEP_ID=MMETSP1058-20130122/24039_1 /TAXON_ID=83371 /ORGANISM="Detonula confervacea, Strain CCMP 353" /LENGTH=599 /DNA_ID=CAMNT_0013029069 /DNA_START=1 /DNA_END=1800 /DNA_ORIENTATION=+